MRKSLLVSLLLGIGCAGLGSPPAENVDADFEARLARGQLLLEPPKGTATSLHPEPSESPIAATAAGSAEVAADDTPAVEVEFHVFSIGQADSMLVIGPPPQNKTLLIDVGEVSWNSRRNCPIIRNHVEALTGGTHVDYLLITHFHGDHAGTPKSWDQNGRAHAGGGLFCLLDGDAGPFSVGTLIDRGDTDLKFRNPRHSIHQAIINTTEAWKNSGSLENRVAADFSDGVIDLGPGVTVEVISTAGKVAKDDPGVLAAVEAVHPGTYSTQPSPNDFSVGLEISVGDFEFFTAGDLTGAPGEPEYAPFFKTQHNQIYTNVESYMVEHWTNRPEPRESDVEVYRANHHGSGNSSTTHLAYALKPELVIYSCGGSHGHPSKSIVERFSSMGADQIVTTRVDSTDSPWENGFPEHYGNGWDNPAGDISIHVPIHGSYYTVETADQAFQYPIYSDEEESE
jgi:beta-lactamase superfamily II metal-dependent hydrolase